MVDIIFFSLSLFACGAIVYILTMLWFSNTHTPQLKGFMGFGAAAALWIFFSAIASIAAPQYFVVLYTLHTVTGCLFPYVFLWYALQYSNSRLVRNKPFICLLCIIPLLDAIAFATNPLHRLMFLTYDYPDLPTGPLFWIHAILGYIAFLASLIVIFAYVSRRARRTPLIMLTAFSTLFPFVINVLLAFNLLGTRHDFTSVGFFVTFTLFFVSTYRAGPFSFKAVALTNIFTSLSDIIMIANARGVIVDANVAFGNTFPAFPLTIGKSTVSEFAAWLSLYVVNCAPDTLLSELDDLRRDHPSGEFTVRISDDTGYNFMTFTLRRDVIWKKKNPSGYLITMANVSTYRAMISEINQQNERLLELKELAEEASRTKSSFLANMSHEIRTPINAITGMVAVMRGTDDREKIRDCMNKIDAASKQLLSLINDILDISKIEANRMELGAEPFALPHTLRNVQNIISISAAAKNQVLAFLLDDNLPQAVVGDDMRLSQILLNLLSNAVKFTPENGHISLSARLRETKDNLHYLEVAVQDDGIGMTEEQQRRLFRNFEQADTSISKRYGGTGLGLVISKSLAELMGGSIALESVFGAGSCFTVQFCLQVCDDDSLLSDSTVQDYDFAGRTVLLAEDVEINREIVMTMLERVGMLVDCAENGQQALDLFLANPARYHIIFMDIQMPMMDGYTAARAIRAAAAPNAATIPIVAMTANAFAEDVTHSHDVGMNDHIAKPIDFDLLYQKMAKLMAAE